MAKHEFYLGEEVVVAGSFGRPGRYAVVMDCSEANDDPARLFVQHEDGCCEWVSVDRVAVEDGDDVFDTSWAMAHETIRQANPDGI